MSKSLEWINWSHSFTSYPDFIEYPATEQELVAIVKKAAKEQQTVKVVGSGHSCSLISGTKNGYLLDLKDFNAVLELDTHKKTIRVEGGTSLEKIAKHALQNNLAFDNLGTIVEQSIAGAISTGTHGSGITHGSLDQAILSFTILTASGEKKVFDREKNTEEFFTAVVGIGALGIITEVTLQLVENYNLEIETKTLSFSEMIASIANFEKDDYMRFWWAPHTDKVQYWKATKTEEKATPQSKLKNWYQDIFKGNKLHEFGLWLTANKPSLIPNLNKWMFSLVLNKEVNFVTDFLDGFTLPILVKQSVMEYGIPAKDTASVLKKIEQLLAAKSYKVHMPIEVRFAPQNNAALSMAYGTDTCYIGIIAYKPYGKELDYKAYFKDVHDIFAAHNGRPHWAKVTHYSKKELNDLYPKWGDFEELKNVLDSKGMFMNDFLKRIF